MATLSVKRPQLEIYAIRALWLCVVVASVVMTIIYFQGFLVALGVEPSHLVGIGLTPQFANVVAFTTECVWIGVFWLVSLYLVVQRPRNIVVYLVSAVGFMVPVRVAFMQVIPFSYLPPWFPLIAQTSFLAVFATLSYVAFAVFPDGNFVPAWSRWWVLARFAIMFNYVANLVPFLNRIYVWVDIVMFSALIYAKYASWQRMRTPIQRQQTKWVLFGMSIGLAFFFLKRLGDTYPVSSEVYVLIFFLSRLAVLSIPLAVTFALLRYRLYDVDWVLNRGLLYGFVTVLLGSVFVMVYAAIQVLLGNLVAVQPAQVIGAVASAMLVAALFNEVRHVVSRFIDTRFFRLRVDFDELQRLQRTSRLRDDVWSGVTIDDLHIGELIGKGGMARVYDATIGSKRVAVKLLPLDLAENPAYRRSFEREVKLTTMLSHPNVVQMLRAGVANDTPYIVMEYIEGEELGQTLARVGKLPLEQARLIVRDVAAALDYIHGQGIVHRDVKPANVIVQELRAVLADFGLATIVPRVTDTNSGIFGTLEFIAPEQIRNDVPITTRADIYALGVLTYRMVTGVHPFAGSLSQIVFGHLNQPPDDPRLLVPDLPEASAKAILRSLAKEPDERFALASAFASAL